MDKIRLIANEGHSLGENQISNEQNGLSKKEFPHIDYFMQYKAAKQNVFSSCVMKSLQIVLKQLKNLKKFGIVKTYYVQVNTGNELQKSGVKMNEVDEFIHTIRGEYKPIDG